MTKYMYYEEMQALSLKACNAFKVISKDPCLIDFYSAAEEGFFTKKNNLALAEAREPITPAQIDRLAAFKYRVEKWEAEAAYEIRNQEKCNPDQSGK